MSHETQGRKEVIEAGVTALVTAAGAALGTWLVNIAEDAWEARQKAKRRQAKARNGGAKAPRPKRQK